MKKTVVLFGFLACACGQSWAAPITVTFEPQAAQLSVGAGIAIDVLADIPDPVLGFGLDLDFDAQRLALTDTLFGDLWTPLPAPPAPVSDGQGVGALLTPGFPPPLPPGGVAGDGLLLFTLLFDAVAPGLADFSLSFTPGDPSEGFVLASGGFAEVAFVAGAVDVRPAVIPVPGAALLMLTGLLGIALGASRNGFRTATADNRPGVHHDRSARVRVGI